MRLDIGQKILSFEEDDKGRMNNDTCLDNISVPLNKGAQREHGDQGYCQLEERFEIS